MSGFSFLAEESAILLHAGILGLEMGLIYDFLRVIRQVWRSGFFITAFMDLSFWGFTAYRTFGVMHIYSNGTLRWFAVLGTIVMLWLYQGLISKYLVSVCVFFLLKLRNVITKIKKVLTNNLKMSIIKVGKHSGKGERYGEKSYISDKVS